MLYNKTVLDEDNSTFFTITKLNNIHREVLLFPRENQNLLVLFFLLQILLYREW